MRALGGSGGKANQRNFMPPLPRAGGSGGGWAIPKFLPRTQVNTTVGYKCWKTLRAPNPQEHLSPESRISEAMILVVLQFF